MFYLYILYMHKYSVYFSSILFFDLVYATSICFNKLTYLGLL